MAPLRASACASAPLRPALRARRSARRGPKLVALAGLAAALLRAGGGGSRAYAVKGAWDSKPIALKGFQNASFANLLQGLEPNVTFPTISYSRSGLTLGVSGDRLVADYRGKLAEDTDYDFQIDDETDWNATLLGHGTALRVQGHGADWDDLYWEAAQLSRVEEVGDVAVQFNSKKDYNLTIARKNLATIAGVDLDAKVRATNAGLAARLGAHRLLPKGLEASYSVENPVGVYDARSLKHVGRLTAPVAGGTAVLQAAGSDVSKGIEGYYARGLGGGMANVSLSQIDGEGGYNASYAYARTVGEDVPIDVGVHVGVDEDGAYGKFLANREFGDGLHAEYEAYGRAPLDDDDQKKKQLRHSLKLGSQLGYMQLLQGVEEPVRLRVGYEFHP